jgi:orotate phosphoribosyltransferase-like protein
MKKQDIKEISKLRNKGWTLQNIANKYKIDHTTVYYYLVKSGVAKPKKVIRKQKPKYVPNRKYTKVGKSYQDYLDAQKKPDAIERAKKNLPKNCY